MTRRRGALGALAALGLSLVTGLAAVPAAEAVTGSPPVTTPDAGTMFPGNAVFLSPVNNDSDPDNDALTICRLGTEQYKGFETDFVGNDWAVFSKPSVKPGTYTFTYYACDFSYLTPGTITITVAAAPDITVEKIDGRPGKLRVKNPADFKIRFLYGSFRQDRPDGTMVIGAGESVTISVHRTRIDWIAFNRRGDIFLATGKVLNIKLPPGGGPAVGRADLPSRLAEAWRTA